MFCDNCDIECETIIQDPDFTQFWYCMDCYLIMMSYQVATIDLNSSDE